MSRSFEEIVDMAQEEQDRQAPPPALTPRSKMYKLLNDREKDAAAKS